MKRISYSILAILLMSFGILGCDPEKPATLTDTEAPEIFISHPAPTVPGTYTYFQNNEDIDLDIRFEDDVELRDYIVEVRSAQQLNFLKTNNDYWETTLFGELDGQSDGINTAVPVENDPSAGPYEIRITVEDMSGKVTVKSTYIFIKNDRDLTVPNVVITLPDTNDVDTFNIGTNINVRGTMSDPGGVILDGFVWIKDLSTGEMVPETRVSFDTLNLASYTFNIFVSAPVGTPEGDYAIEAYGRDPVNNYSGAKSFIYLR